MQRTRSGPLCKLFDHTIGKEHKITDASTVSKVIKKLKTGKKYYVRVRSYHEFEGMTYYGQWSNVKSVKVK